MKRKDKRKKHINNIVIDNFDTMQELATGLNSTISNIYASYLRQPITHDLIIGDNYIIHGICALNTENCSYAVNSLSVKECYECEIYKGYFGGQK